MNGPREVLPPHDGQLVVRRKNGHPTAREARVNYAAVLRAAYPI